MDFEESGYALMDVSVKCKHCHWALFTEYGLRFCSLSENIVDEDKKRICGAFVGEKEVQSDG